MPQHVKLLLTGGVTVFAMIGTLACRQTSPTVQAQPAPAIGSFDTVISQNAQRMLEEGRRNAPALAAASCGCTSPS